MIAEVVDFCIEAINFCLIVFFYEGEVVSAVRVFELVGNTCHELKVSKVDVVALTSLCEATVTQCPYDSRLNINLPFLGSTKIEAYVKTCLACEQVYIMTIVLMLSTVVIVLMTPTKAIYSLDVYEAGLTLVPQKQVRKVECHQTADVRSVKHVVAVIAVVVTSIDKGIALKSKHDLGIHTEMFTDSMVELIACGAVNNSKKQIHRGKTVTTFAFGSKRIYDYIDDNPAIEILPVNYVNDPAVICKNDNMISINAAVEVDLWGQVCAESIGTKHLSGTGGQVDFVRGACQSRGGKSFIAFTSTAKGGTISKIQPILTPGALCTTSKNDVDYIVTEYGIAQLRGLSLSKRVKNLISIAHPDFRDELTFEAKKRGMI